MVLPKVIKGVTVGLVLLPSMVTGVTYTGSTTYTDSSGKGIYFIGS